VVNDVEPEGMELFHCAGPVRFSRQAAVSRVYDIEAKFTLMMAVRARSNLDVDQLNPPRLCGLTSPKLDRNRHRAVMPALFVPCTLPQ
jgi:hypothetical protein